MEVDTEMQDAGKLPDDDSLASTELSDDDKEYEVEECLAEKTSKNGKKRYLLKWTGYPIYRASWEPPSLFVHMEEEMLRWQEKKRKIVAGLEQPFDVQAWERGVKQWKRETQARKEARRQKRAKRDTQKKGQDLAPPASHAQSTSRESSPDVPLMQTSRESSPDVPLIRTTASKGATSRKSHHRSASTSSDVSSLFVSADDPQPKRPISKGEPPTSTPATAFQSSSSSGLTRVQLEPPSSSTSARTVSGTSGGPGPQPSQASVPASDNSQPIQPSQLHISQSADSAQQSQPLSEAPQTANSEPDKVSNQGPSQTTGQKAATGTQPSREAQSQKPHASLGRTVEQSALGHLYTVFASNKISHRQPDISQLDLRKPSEFPARTAAGVPVPFATMTASDKFRRTSHSGTKATSATGSSRPQTTSWSGIPQTGPSETRDPLRAPRAPEAERPGRSRPPSPRSCRLSFGGDSYRPSDSRPSSPSRRPDPRGRSPDSRRRSLGGHSRSPDRRSRSPERRRSPVSRRRSPDHRRAADTYRPTAPSPFVNVTRPKTRPPVPTTSTRPSLPPAATPPATMAHAESNSNLVSENTLELRNNSPCPPHEPPMSMKDKINRMPIGQPGRGAKFFHGHYFVNPGEILAHVYFGPERHFVGAVRICGLSSRTKSDLLEAKGPSSKFEMWFEHICTKAQYDALCQIGEGLGGSNAVIRTCWMEGFADTNPEIFHMSEELDANNKVGIYYPPGDEGFVWLAYSPKSPDFGNLTLPFTDISPWVPIRLAVRPPLPPIYALKESALGEPEGYQQPPSSTMAMVPHGPVNTSVKEVPISLNDVVGRLAQIAGPSNLDRPVPAQGSYRSPIPSPMEQRSPVLPLHGELAWESQQARPTALNQSNPPVDPRLRRSSSIGTSTQQPPHGQLRTAEDGSGKITFENFTGAIMQKPSDLMDARSGSTVPADTALTSAFQNTSIQRLSDQNSMLKELFHRELKMSFKELASVNGKQDGQQADMFYLHAPDGQEAQNECTILKAWLEMEGAMVWSDWTKFLRNSKCGVILFHESFRRYDVLRPNLRDALRLGSIGFWTFRIARPLDYADLRYCQQGIHFQRLFSRGGAYLLTEDVLQDLSEALSIVYWFYGILKSNAGQWKLVCWPNLLESLDEKLATPGLSKEDQRYLHTLIWLIRKCNSFDPLSPFFDPDSLNSAKLDGPNNNILSLTVAGYGERTAQLSPSLPRNLTQAERNADHLAESFAGWGMENAARLRRFYIVSNCKNEALRKRWAGWGHVNVFSVQSFLEKYKQKIGKDVLERLQTKSKQTKPSSARSSHSGPSNDRNPVDLSSPIQTPQTPMTMGGPTTRDSSADPSNCPRPTQWRQPQPQEGHRYAAPYR